MGDNMKTYNITFLIVILLGVLLLSSCNSSPHKVTQEMLPESATSPNSVTNSPPPTVSTSLTSSADSTEPSPSAIITATLEVTPATFVLIPTATSEVKSIPTTSVLLSPMIDQEKRLTNLLDLLNTNGGCDLPCWWGISPGQSSWSGAQQFLLSIGANIYSNFEFGKLIHATPNFNEPVIKISDNQPGTNDNKIYFVEKDKIIEQIYVNADGWTNPKVFQSHWRSYMPRQILEKYGLPDRIRVYTNSVIMGDRHSYDLWFIYDCPRLN